MKLHYIANIQKTKRVRQDLAREKSRTVDELDELMQDFNDSWQDKARRLQARRWRRIMRGS